ncbi:DUF4834 family protein [Hymenobacter endophyticus]|uniref:DUF4834 family protein n=1 Tax=Hymenobacter endophyticus TaxID=3076335 RepID=A0ABU3THU1_9BACT|nr:DUF4834 family protein [Hymenobacter endophyticus]MDU0370944.1 DUF4834 family protein [Hymenobacter endophyticus]
MKFFLVLIVLWLFVRYVLPLVLRFAVKHLLKKQAQKFGQHYGANPFANPSQTSARPSHTPTGEVQVEYVPPRAKPPRPREFNGGEYVDFEEVK